MKNGVIGHMNLPEGREPEEEEEDIISRSRVKIPTRVEIWFETSAPPAPHSQLCFDEYTDCTLSVGR